MPTATSSPPQRASRDGAKPAPAEPCVACGAGTHAAAGTLPDWADVSALYAMIVEHMPLGMCIFDADDRLLMSNRRYCELWSLPESLGRPGTPFSDIMAATRGHEVPHERAEMEPPRDGRSTRRRRVWELDDGRVIEVVVTRLESGACVALHEDITSRRRSEQHIAHLARHDPLTGLANLAHLQDALQRHLPRAGRGTEVALLCLDLDRFKIVNDTLGHPAGDALLKQVAARMRQVVRSGDVVSRLGGDEFAILQVDSPQPAGSTALARRLIAGMAEPFDVDGHLVHIGTSVGVAVAPFDGDRPDVLLKNADLALYRAKADGRSLLRYFEPAMDARMQARRQLEVDLRGAIDRGEFELAFQPQVALDTGAVAGVEALIRWNHPSRGRVSPADFIPLAEESGLIVPIGRWVLQRACEVAAQWPADVRICVNVSPVQFGSRTLVTDVVRALERGGIAPQRLELEITEAVLMRNTEQALAVLHELRERGVRIAMDDFGTGYSSLSYLRRFPLDRIKIDRSFVCDVEKSGDALAIIRAINGLALSLGMATTVEGVETNAQLEAIRGAGCAEVQGYLFSGPRPAEEIAGLVRTGLIAAIEAPSTPPAEGSTCSSASST